MSILVMLWVVFGGLSLAEIRTGFVKLYSTVPYAFVRNEMETGLLENDPDRLVQALSKQFATSRTLGLTRVMVDDLLDNATLISNTQFTKRPHRTLPALFNSIEKAAPGRYYELLVLKARAYVAIDPKRAYAEAKKASGHLPTDERPYRTLMRLAARSGDIAAIDRLCEQYSSASKGAFEVRSRPIMGRPGHGYHIMYLESGDGSEINKFAVHRNIQLDVPALYNFDLVEHTELKSLRLHLPFAPGTRVQMHEIRFHTQDGTIVLQPKDMILMPTNGYAISHDTFISTSPTGDALTLFPRIGDLPGAHRIEFNITVHRLPLIGGSACSKS